MVQSKKVPHCRICKKPVVAKFRPFCSERCKLIDLSHWLKGTYVVPGSESDTATDQNEEEDEES